MAERAAAAKKRRRTQVTVTSAVLAVVVVGAAVWIYAANRPDDSKKKSVASAQPAGTVACTWIPEDASSGAKITDVGTPPKDAPNTGTDTLTINTNLGPIAATVDKAKAPCTAEAFTYLASKKFWD